MDIAMNVTALGGPSATTTSSIATSTDMVISGIGKSGTGMSGMMGGSEGCKLSVSHLQYQMLGCSVGGLSHDFWNKNLSKHV